MVICSVVPIFAMLMIFLFRSLLYTQKSYALCTQLICLLPIFANARDLHVLTFVLYPEILCPVHLTLGLTGTSTCTLAHPTVPYHLYSSGLALLLYSHGLS